jgi:hypothetical protein
MTTEEFLAETARQGIAALGQAEQLWPFLLRCDLVKFAGYAPTVTEIKESLAVARSIIRNTGESASHDLQ